MDDRQGIQARKECAGANHFIVRVGGDEHNSSAKTRVSIRSQPGEKV
jgi:hypothetical protein